TYIIAGTVLVLVAIAAILLLRRQPSGPAETNQGRKMLAVLPFENLGTPEQEYFADGLTEEITNRLSGLSGLGVIARSSAVQYKKTTKTLQQIGNELGVGYVLQGTIRWGASTEGGARVRVSPVLVKVSDGTQAWSQPYDAVFSDVFKIQSDIASQVAGALGVTLLQPERKSLEASHTENSEAYDAYLRGNDYFRRSYREQDFQIALQMFGKAVGLDPKFALAYARLSEAHSAMYWFHYDHTKERLAKAKAAVDEALRLDPGLPEAHASLGYYYYWGYLDYENALKELALAQKIRPNDSELLLGIGAVQRRQGKFELAAATMTKASELDPRSSQLAFNTAQTYALLRNYPEAERFADRAISLAPDLISRYTYKAFLYLLWSGDTKRAKALLQQASTIAGAEDDQEILLNRALIEMFDGNYREALGVISSGPMKPFDDQFQFIPRAQLFAEVYGLMKQRELERAYYDSARVLLER
ncbi:MAG: tetratricopeptide repeat protein, partial [Bacteroidota bacterium]